MNRALLVLLIVGLAAFSGCVTPQETNAVVKARENPAISDFTAKHPAARLTSYAWSREDSQRLLTELETKCGPQVPITDYYYIAFRDGSASAEAWVTQKSGIVVCVHRSDDTCIVNSNCDDGNPCTADNCSGVPKKCVHEQKTACVDNDGCCSPGCSYGNDSDCQPVVDKCVSEYDCDDMNSATLDTCSGKPKKCRNTQITKCIGGDYYCPPGCINADDSDCTAVAVPACKANADCDDKDTTTKDTCTGEPASCVHTKITACVSGDGYCPAACASLNDTDCVANAGDNIRVNTVCAGISTRLDQPLAADAGLLKASFDTTLTSKNNSAFKAYPERGYTYNEFKKSVNMTEGLYLSGLAQYDRQQNTAQLQVVRGGLVYTSNLGEGIPTTRADNDNIPFVSGNDDSIIIPFFGKDAFVLSVDKGKGEITVVSSAYLWIVNETDIAINLEGKDGTLYSMTISKCAADKAILSLNKDTGLVESQAVSVGDVLFPETLKKTIVLAYWNRSSENKCNYRYITGDYVETIKDGGVFPSGTGSGEWKSYLQFSSNRLQKITIKNTSGKWFDSPLAPTQAIKVASEDGTAGKQFCTITFDGLVK